MKKAIALCAALLMLLSIPAAYGASDVEILPLTSVDNMQPAERPQASLEYQIHGEKVRISQLEAADLDAMLQAMLDGGLVYDTQRSEQLPADRPKESSELPLTPQEGRLFFLDAAPDVQWHISFDETGALVERIWVNAPYGGTFSHGFFTYGKAGAYQSLADICQTLAGEKQEGQSQLQENQQWVYDFEILYHASMPTGIEAAAGDTLNWGICAYRHTPSGGLLTRVFVNYPDEEGFLYLITDTLQNGNTVQIDGATAILFGQDGREYANQEFLENWTLQFSINDQMEVVGADITMMRNDTGNFWQSTVDMSQYRVHTSAGNSALPQTEQFPFAPNWTEPEKPAESQPQQEDQTSSQPDEKPTTEQEPSETGQLQPEDGEQQPEQPEDKPEQPELPADKTQQPENNAAAGTPAIAFSDVPQGHWAYPAIQKLAQNHVILGYGDGTFGTNDPLTYQQFALLLERQFGYQDTHVSPEPAMREHVIVSLVKALGLDTANTDSTIIEQTFSDCQTLQPENRPYIAAAIRHGLIEGADGKLFAYSDLTRAEAAVLLDRAISFLSGR